MYNDFKLLDNFENIAHAYHKNLKIAVNAFSSSQKIKTEIDENLKKVISLKINENINLYSQILRESTIKQNQNYINTLIKESNSILVLLKIENVTQNYETKYINRCDCVKMIIQNNIFILKQIQNENDELSKELQIKILHIIEKTITLFGNCSYRKFY